VQSVPSALAVGPDGALYVGELTGWPYRIGAARVWRIAPGTKPKVFATGFTNISDLAFDGNDMLVLEIASKGIQNPASTGVLIRVSPGGKRIVLASKGLVFPTGVAVGKGWIYISNYGTYPGTGPAPHGELVRVRS
jgi:sugar lactone lactonase YvrE